MCRMGPRRVPVVKVDSRPRAVIHDVERDIIVAGHSLEERARLLGEYAVLVHMVPSDQVVRGEIPVRAVRRGQPPLRPSD